MNLFKQKIILPYFVNLIIPATNTENPAIKWLNPINRIESEMSTDQCHGSGSSGLNATNSVNAAINRPKT